MFSLPTSIHTAICDLQNIFNHVVPESIQDKIMSKVGICNLFSTTCIIIKETNGYTRNEVFEAAETYLRTRITPSVKKIQVSKGSKEKNLLINLHDGQEIVDNFEGTALKWKLVCEETPRKADPHDPFSSVRIQEKRSFQLRFNKKFHETVLNSYLPFVLERSKEINEESRVIILYQMGRKGQMGSVKFDHPSTFETLAMDPTVKNELIEDLNRFLRRRDFYRRVGKAWKRGYLLYGPPGTGKSSLVAAIANHLKFDIYDLDLKNQLNSEMKRILASTKNRSIFVIEDIDCSIDLKDRQDREDIRQSDHQVKLQDQLTLSGLLNFIDGLWSSCGDERLIIVTTNHIDRLDPALLRPGRMDMRILMSYCTFGGFEILASNYLGIKSHSKFEVIKKMIGEVEVTPAEIAAEMMKSEDVEITLDKVVELLCTKRDESIEEVKDVAEEKEDEMGEEKKAIEMKRKRGGEEEEEDNENDNDSVESKKGKKLGDQKS